MFPTSLLPSLYSDLQPFFAFIPRIACFNDKQAPAPDKRRGLNRSMQHHLMDLLFKDGVYEPGETVETFSHAEN